MRMFSRVEGERGRERRPSACHERSSTNNGKLCTERAVIEQRKQKDTLYSMPLCFPPFLSSCLRVAAPRCVCTEYPMGTYLPK